MDETLTFAEMDRRARTVGALLQHLQLAGERALLLYPPGPAFAAAFYGCLYAGVVAVPAYPPRPNRSLERAQRIAADAQVSVVLTTSSLLSSVEKGRSGGVLPWRATDELSADLAAAWQERAFSGDGLAYLQYTSGTTAAPKGVMIAHDALVHNLGLIHGACSLTEETHAVLWLPPYHDMGLGNGLLQPVYSGCSVTLMTPAAFLQRPYRWLHAMSRSRATVSGGPNFAYDLCVREVSVEQRATLDLTNWRLAFNGSEPIHAETQERFAAAFAPCGFDREAYFAAYGLAEARLFVAGGYTTPKAARDFDEGALRENRVVERPSRAPGSRAVSSCGWHATDLTVRIVDPETRRPCPTDRVGEIWIAGPSVACGYWMRDEETAAAFGGYLAESGEGPFLRTGDLGFLLEEQLFVTGRFKDLLIIRGRNHYPQEIEFAVERCHPTLRPAASAAFSVEINEEERPVVVAEVERRFHNAETPEVVAAIRRAVAEEHDLDLHAVRLLRIGTLPRTTSGKVQRHACREAFLAGTLTVVGEWTHEELLIADCRLMIEGTPLPPNQQSAISNQQSLRGWLTDRLAAVAGVAPDEIDVRRPFASFGLDSLGAARLVGDMEEALGRSLSPTLVYEYPTIEALAAYLAKGALGGRVPSARCPVPGARLGRDGEPVPGSFPAGRALGTGHWAPSRPEPSTATEGSDRSPSSASAVAFPAATGRRRSGGCCGRGWTRSPRYRRTGGTWSVTMIHDR